eukprot:6343555-Pyramimonas_sp.AAC.1
MDFDVMRTFVKRTVMVVKARVPSAKVGMLQFTTEVRVEIAPTSEAAEVVGQKVDGMTRMNGGTNLTAPILRVSAQLKHSVVFHTAASLVCAIYVLAHRC